jgi:hypothetical protein
MPLTPQPPTLLRSPHFYASIGLHVNHKLPIFASVRLACLHTEPSYSLLLHQIASTNFQNIDTAVARFPAQTQSLAFTHVPNRYCGI